MVGVRARHPDALDAPGWLQKGWLVLALAPLIAGVATGRLYRPGKPGRRYPLTMPGVFVTKLAWCVGAARPAALGGNPGGEATATGIGPVTRGTETRGRTGMHGEQADWGRS
jgi:hypothetical protein